MPAKSIDRLRKLCLSLPEAHEVDAWNEPTFRVRNKIFAMYASSDSHHGGGRTSVWCKAKPVTQDMMTRAEPDRYFSPPYVGPKGWVGVWLDKSTDWDTLASLLLDAYQLTAPKRLLAQMNEARTGTPAKKSAKKSTKKSTTKSRKKSTSTSTLKHGTRR